MHNDFDWNLLNFNCRMLSILVEFSGEYEFFRCDRSRKKGGVVMLVVKEIFFTCLVYKESVHNAYEVLYFDLNASSTFIRSLLLLRHPYSPKFWVIWLYVIVRVQLLEISICQTLNGLGVWDIHQTVLSRSRSSIPVKAQTNATCTWSNPRWIHFDLISTNDPDSIIFVTPAWDVQ